VQCAGLCPVSEGCLTFQALAAQRAHAHRQALCGFPHLPIHLQNTLQKHLAADASYRAIVDWSTGGDL
jgi:hypothetical protein